MSVEFDQIFIEPAYRKVAAAIGERILNRSLREGDRLPAELELARQFGVNRSTVREALRELESNGLVMRRPGSRRMSVSRPQHMAIAETISRGLVLHDVTFLEVWQALTLLEPPIAEAAATARNDDDLAAVGAACEQFVNGNTQAGNAARNAAEFFRSVARATHNQVLGLAQEPLLQLLEPSLRIMIDKVPQARSRISGAQRRICDALKARDSEGARTWMARHIRDFRKGFELAGIGLEQRLTTG
ncbi:MAG TPA: GntR family transcriptional regulator [Steroidobacteraceae bacterium]|nr:GntR family transcriptional regulator [Steroidobacteraceae bacterium]